MLRWYRRARVAGASAIALGFAGMIFVFPFIAGDPGSVADSEIPDPAWTRVVSGIAFAVLVLGLLMLLAPNAHRLLRRRRL